MGGQSESSAQVPAAWLAGDTKPRWLRLTAKRRAWPIPSGLHLVVADESREDRHPRRVRRGPPLRPPVVGAQVPLRAVGRVPRAVGPAWRRTARRAIRSRGPPRGRGGRRSDSPARPRGWGRGRGRSPSGSPRSAPPVLLRRADLDVGNPVAVGVPARHQLPVRAHRRDVRVGARIHRRAVDGGSSSSCRAGRCGRSPRSLSTSRCCRRRCLRHRGIRRRLGVASGVVTGSRGPELGMRSASACRVPRRRRRLGATARWGGGGAVSLNGRPYSR